MYHSNPFASNKNGDGNGQRNVQNRFGTGPPMTLAFRPIKNNRTPAAEQSRLSAEANPFNFNPVSTPRTPSLPTQSATTLSPCRRHIRGHRGYHGLGHRRRHPAAPRLSAPASAPGYTPYPIGTSIMGPDGGPTPVTGPFNYLTGTLAPNIGMRRASAQYPPELGSLIATPSHGQGPLHQQPPAPTPALPSTPDSIPADHPTVAPHLMLIPTQVPLPPPSRPYPTRANAGGYTLMWNCCGCGDGPNSTGDNMCFGCHHARCRYCANIWS
ncbi:hypothetical protein BDV19DRAFT_385270 [Aspergillus venezuelensis]